MTKTLRQLIESGEQILAPGCGDALGALIVEKAGFNAVSMSGYQAAATLGYPDMGLGTLSEMVSLAARICDTVKIPLIADADNGHGNAVNVIRTVREFERAGAAAIHLEDQVLPKKCGHMQGQVLVSTSEMCGKLEAAIDARKSREFMIIARSDAINTDGLEEAIHRGREYRKAGADAIMIMAPRSVDDLRRYRDGVEGPLVVTIGSWDFHVTNQQLKDMGYQMVLFPLTTLRRNIMASLEVLADLKTNGFVDHAAKTMISMHDLHGLLGQGQVLEWEQKYRAKDELKAEGSV